MKPYASSCDDNSEPILRVITPYLYSRQSVLEIASGTGQHAIYFCKKLPHLTWQTSDLPIMLPGIQQWIDDSKFSQVLNPIALDVCTQWPAQSYDAVFSANALHIMNWQQVQCFFNHLSSALHTNGLCILYGPFNYAGQYTSESNARFDQWLKQRDPLSGIRDFESINSLAERQGLQLIKDHSMPSNNRTLVFQKR